MRPVCSVTVECGAGKWTRGHTVRGSERNLRLYLRSRTSEYNTLCFGQSKSEGKRRGHKFIMPGILLQKLLVGLILQLGNKSPFYSDYDQFLFFLIPFLMLNTLELVGN